MTNYDINELKKILLSLKEDEAVALLMLKGKDGEKEKYVKFVKDWAEDMGCEIIFEAPAKYDDKACAVHYCKMLNHPIYPNLNEYITGGISYGMIIKASRETLRETKKGVGKPVNPAPESLRGLLFTLTGRTEDKNFVHCSDVDELDLEGNSLALKEIFNFLDVAENTKETNLSV